jgi:hypothetical protein
MKCFQDASSLSATVTGVLSNLEGLKNEYKPIDKEES